MIGGAGNFLFFAASDVVPLPGAVSRNTSAGALFDDVMLVVAAALGLGVILIALVYVRQRAKNRSSRRSSRSKSSPAVSRLPENDGEAEEQSPRYRRKRKRMRRDHRPRNPTLAETGGLPPERDGPPPIPEA